MEDPIPTVPVNRLTTMARRVDLNLGSDIICVQHGFQGVSPKRVHENLIRQRSKTLASRIVDARKAHDSNVAIKISMPDTAKVRWCAWLYGQAFWTYSEDLGHALLDIGAICRFSAEEGDQECVNACLDAIREILVDEHGRVTIRLHTLLEFLVQTQEASQMLVDVLVYGPYATSGLTRNWLRETKVEPEFLSFFYHLSLAFATRVANKAAGYGNVHPDIMAPGAYHLPIIEESDTACDSATDVGETNTSSIAQTRP